jgi:hypothetical protein
VLRAMPASVKPVAVIRNRSASDMRTV